MRMKIAGDNEQPCLIPTPEVVVVVVVVVVVGRKKKEESLNYGVEWRGVVGGILEITVAAAGFTGHFCLAHNRCYSFVTFARCTKCRRPRVTHKTHHRLLGTLPNAGTREFCSLLMMAM